MGNLQAASPSNQGPTADSNDHQDNKLFKNSASVSPGRDNRSQRGTNDTFGLKQTRAHDSWSHTRPVAAATGIKNSGSTTAMHKKEQQHHLLPPHKAAVKKHLTGNLNEESKTNPQRQPSKNVNRQHPSIGVKSTVEVPHAATTTTESHELSNNTMSSRMGHLVPPNNQRRHAGFEYQQQQHHQESIGLGQTTTIPLFTDSTILGGGPSKQIRVYVDKDIEFTLNIYDHLTCGWLLSEVTRRYREALHNIKLHGQQRANGEIKKYTRKMIVALKTTDQRESLDYWLTQYDRQLDVIQDGDFLIAHFAKFLDKRRLHQSLEQEISKDDFEQIKVIGRGGFSRVVLARKKDSGRLYALKIMKKERIFREKKLKPILSERNILEQLNNKHPFLIKLHWAFQTNEELYFIMDVCTGGELFYHLSKLKRLDEITSKFYFAEILLGLEHLHSMNVVYRDIKPENILLDIDGHIRIADFGLSKVIPVRQRSYSFCGSPEYMSPEMLSGVGHDRRLDIYCLGALLYEMLTGLPPFYDRVAEIMYQRILEEEVVLPDDMGPNRFLIQDLISKMMIKDPKGRYQTLEEVKRHPWLVDINWNDILEKKIPPPIIPNVRESHIDPDYTELPLDFEEQQLQLQHQARKGRLSTERRYSYYYESTIQSKLAPGDNPQSFFNHFFERNNNLTNDSVCSSSIRGPNTTNTLDANQHLYQGAIASLPQDHGQSVQSEQSQENNPNAMLYTLIENFTFIDVPQEEIQVLQEMKKKHGNAERHQARGRARQVINPNHIHRDTMHILQHNQTDRREQQLHPQVMIQQVLTIQRAANQQDQHEILIEEDPEQNQQLIYSRNNVDQRQEASANVLIKGQTALLNTQGVGQGVQQTLSNRSILTFFDESNQSIAQEFRVDESIAQVFPIGQVGLILEVSMHTDNHFEDGRMTIEEEQQEETLQTNNPPASAMGNPVYKSPHQKVMGYQLNQQTLFQRSPAIKHDSRSGSVNALSLSSMAEQRTIQPSPIQVEQPLQGSAQMTKPGHQHNHMMNYDSNFSSQNQRKNLLIKQAQLVSDCYDIPQELKPGQSESIFGSGTKLQLSQAKTPTLSINKSQTSSTVMSPKQHQSLNAAQTPSVSTVKKQTYNGLPPQYGGGQQSAISTGRNAVLKIDQASKKQLSSFSSKIKLTSSTLNSQQHPQSSSQDRIKQMQQSHQSIGYDLFTKLPSKDVPQKKSSSSSIIKDSFSAAIPKADYNKRQALNSAEHSADPQRGNLVQLDQDSNSMSPRKPIQPHRQLKPKLAMHTADNTARGVSSGSQKQKPRQTQLIANKPFTTNFKKMNASAMSHSQSRIQHQTNMPPSINSQGSGGTNQLMNNIGQNTSLIVNKPHSQMANSNNQLAEQPSQLAQDVPQMPTTTENNLDESDYIVTRSQKFRSMDGNAVIDAMHPQSVFTLKNSQIIKATQYKSFAKLQVLQEASQLQGEEQTFGGERAEFSKTTQNVINNQTIKTSDLKIGGIVSAAETGEVEESFDSSRDPNPSLSLIDYPIPPRPSIPGRGTLTSKLASTSGLLATQQLQTSALVESPPNKRYHHHTKALLSETRNSDNSSSHQLSASHKVPKKTTAVLLREPSSTSQSVRKGSMLPQQQQQQPKLGKATTSLFQTPKSSLGNKVLQLVMGTTTQQQPSGNANGGTPNSSLLQKQLAMTTAVGNSGNVETQKMYTTNAAGKHTHQSSGSREKQKVSRNAANSMKANTVKSVMHTKI